MSTSLVQRSRTSTATLVRRLRASAEPGMTTAEYAVGTLAACAFAAVLMAVIKSGIVKSLVEVLFKTALAVIK